jgi:hypothetical protein
LGINVYGGRPSRWSLIEVSSQPAIDPVSPDDSPENRTVTKIDPEKPVLHVISHGALIVMGQKTLIGGSKSRY